MSFKIFGFSIFNIKNGCILTLISSYRVAASFITSKFLEHDTENEEFEKSRVLQKCPFTHIISNNNNNNMHREFRAFSQHV